MQAIMATEEVESLDPTMLIPVSILQTYYHRLLYPCPSWYMPLKLHIFTMMVFPFYET
jgi:hypothetical protein